MAGVDFSVLNPQEFQDLVCTLVECREGKPVSRFAPGRDRGIDGLLYFGNERWVVQAKHFERSKFADLRTTIRDIEAAKVAKLAPSRYILATSLPLTPDKANELRSLLPQTDNLVVEVLGRDDVEALLSRFPDVTRRFVKFWLPHSDFLVRMLDRDIDGRSRSFLKQALAAAPKYVPTESHRLARETLGLGGPRAIVFTGQPGAGKSALARQLALELVVDEQFDLVDVADISDIERKLDDSARIVFHWDDFLGSNYFEVLSDLRLDSKLASVLSRFTHDKTKVLLMTSRTTVLQSAFLKLTRFQRDSANARFAEVVVADWTRMQKAQVLFNHLWYSGVSPAYWDKIRKDAGYLKVVGHRNFSPRLVDFVVGMAVHRDVKPAEYFPRVLNAFDRPREVWGEPFKKNLNDLGRAVVRLVAFAGREPSEPELRAALERFAARHLDISRSLGQLGDALEVCVGTLVNRGLHSQTGPANYSLHNPSVRDFVLDQVAGDGELIGELVAAWASATAVKAFETAVRGSAIAPAVSVVAFRKVIELLGPPTGVRHPGVAAAASFLRVGLGNWQDMASIAPAFGQILGAKLEIDLVEDACELATWAIRSMPTEACAAQVAPVADAAMVVAQFTYHVAACDRLVASMPEPAHATSAEKLKALILERWRSWAHDHVVETELLVDRDDYRSLHSQKDSVRDEFRDRLAEYSVEFDDLDVEVLVEEVNFYDILDDNRRRLEKSAQEGPDYDDDGDYGPRDSPEAEIHALFAWHSGG